MRVLVFAERLGRPLIQAFWRWQRGLTLGVRAVVVDSEGQVLLIEHTYLDGWFLPGGGVERAETVHEALTRELVEEAGVRLTGPAQLVSIYDNAKVFRGDHDPHRAGHARFPGDEAKFFQFRHHAVDLRRRDAEELNEVGFGRTAAVQFSVQVDEREELPLSGRERHLRAALPLRAGFLRWRLVGPSLRGLRWRGE